MRVTIGWLSFMQVVSTRSLKVTCAHSLDSRQCCDDVYFPSGRAGGPGAEDSDSQVVVGAW